MHPIIIMEEEKRPGDYRVVETWFDRGEGKVMARIKEDE